MSDQSPLHPEAGLGAVTFDVGGTLITPWPSVGHVYAEVAARHGWQIPPDLLNQRFADAWRKQRNFRHTREQWAALVDATFAGLADKPPSGTFFAELYDRFTDPAAWHMFPDVLPALHSLRAAGVKLGIISNWDDRLRPLLRGFNLLDRFDSVVISCETGAAKPDAAIFERAAAELGLPPVRILHVGDSPDMDVAGARGAGFQAVLLRRAGPAGRDIVRSLGEIRRPE